MVGYGKKSKRWDGHRGLEANRDVPCVRQPLALDQMGSIALSLFPPPPPFLPSFLPFMAVDNFGIEGRSALLLIKLGLYLCVYL